MSLILYDGDISVINAPINLFSEEVFLPILEGSGIFYSDFFEFFHKCKSVKRRKELLVSRLLFLYLMKTNPINIKFYDSIRKEQDILINCFSPSEKTVFTSISHTNKRLSVALNYNSQVSIDIESQKRRVDKIKIFFENKKNLNIRNANPSISLFLWTVYESLYKINALESIQEQVISRFLSQIEDNNPQYIDNINCYFLCIEEYKIFAWRDDITQVYGSLIFTSNETKKIRFFTITSEKYTIEKPCKLNPTGLLNFQQIVDVDICSLL